jgi:hypothetical protein
MTTIRINPVDGNLHCKYPGQSNPQNCYVELDCETGDLSAEHNAEIGNAVPAPVYYGHRQRWAIPALKSSAAELLLQEVASLAQLVIDGYSSEWTGNNYTAQFDDAADAARDQIERLCDNVRDDRDAQLSIWQADDWFSPNSPDDLGVSADTTDDELYAITTRLERDAVENGDDCDGVEGVIDYVTRLRDQLRSVL